ncbi:MAG: SCP2 sterol-binding domain-containing protein, partial [Actinomycetota bacterium]|nr:SCP2 sterol-binding domain-containing protein [Actinomycetota bacterium]
MTGPSREADAARSRGRAGRQEDHPTVRRVRQALARGEARRPPEVLDEEWLRGVCLECGADDAGFVSLGRPEMADQRGDILEAFPHARSVIVFVRRMNREPIRSPARSLANTEFHHVGDGVTATSHEIARRLEGMGVRALNEPVAFPMEQDRWPKPWAIALKPMAVVAGLGQMGIHRNVIHPRFGSFILLGAVIVDRPIGGEGRPVSFNPCFECKLCVAACPVGAISADGNFNFNSCFTHNYREFMGGFGDWVETVVESKNAIDYRSRVSDPETVSMWQSLSFGPNYKAANCVAVCPAGEDVIGPFLEDRKEHLTNVVKPLQDKSETVYVVPGTDAEAYAAKRFPHKKLRRVKNGVRVPTVRSFLDNMVHVFQRGQAEGLDATHHFTFTGAEEIEATVEIRDRKIVVRDGHEGEADLAVKADSRTWVRFLAGEKGIVVALLTRRIRVKGSLRLLVAFGRCFPGS